MKTLTLILLILFVNIFSFAQSQNEINDVGSNAVLIQTKVGSGSGFYLADTVAKKLFLVTASHVLVNPTNNMLLSDTILFISYKKNSQKDARDSFSVALLPAFRNEAFNYDIPTDVAVIKIASFNSGGAIIYPQYVKKVSMSNTRLTHFSFTDTKLIDSLNTIENAYTIGYPKSLSLDYNFDFNRPLIRSGIVSGIDLVKRKIIIDCPTYQGNSGGAVFVTDIFGGNSKIIGLVSQFVPFEEKWFNQAYRYSNTNIYNSGYTVVTPIDNVLAIASILK